MSAPVLTVYMDDPCPRVEVFFDSFLPGTTHVTVFRTAHGVERPVRGAVRAVVAGSLSRMDFEVPFNTNTVYRAELFDAAGMSLGFTETASVTVTSAGSWMHNPLRPTGAVRVELLPSTAQTLSRPVPGQVSYPLGRRVGVVLSEPRRGLAQVVFDVAALTLEDADRVQALIDDVPVVCIRPGGDGPQRVPSPLFLGVLDIPEVDQDVRWGGVRTTHRVRGDEVDPPIPGLYVPLLRAMDINVSFATAAELNASALRASDINRRFDLAGAAG